MDYGKPNFSFGDSEAEKAAQSYPNLQAAVDLMCWDIFNPTMGTEFNGHQLGQSAGTSSGAVHSQPSNIYSTPQGSDLTKNNLPRTGNPETICDRARRKRENDRAYRLRLKEGKMQMKSAFEMLHGENENLKNENGRLQRENDSMNKTLQAQATLIDQLKSDLDKLNDEYKKQNALVQRLSELLACPDLQLENQRLKLENDQLRRNASLENNVFLARENAKLMLENKVLKVQNDALCGKLINDSNERHV